MKGKLPDFYLSSTEHRGDWARVRACWVSRRLRTEDGRDCILVQVDPPVVGQQFGLGDKGLVNLILVPRYKGTVMTGAIGHPLPVLVHRILNPEAAVRPTILGSDVELSAWGEVYPTREAAEIVAKRAGET